MMSRERIQRWMQQCIEQRGYSRFDDLHIDVIDAEPAPREKWLSASLKALREAVQVRDEHCWPFTVALGMSLVNAATPRGPSFARLDDIANELDWSPPSLYLFEQDDDSWLGGDESRELGAQYRPVDVPTARAFLREWYHKQDHEYRRSFWLAVHPRST